MFKDKTLLITGGTGSFGNAVLKRILKTKIKEIRIFSRDEKKQNDMRLAYNDPKLKFYLGDTRNINSIQEAMSGVDLVFHAAALKQVPSCEFFPIEATLTNVIGTSNVIKVAISCNVSKVICLSTDKAAYPINAMGITKALMEKVAIAESRNINNGKTIVCCTRYGNVMGSRGSVIPLFAKQITENKPLTITNPQMTRFMMSLDDAVDLVFYAFKYAVQGDLFIQKAPATTIAILAEALLEIYNSDIEPIIIGSRHGEKLFETLLTKEEYSRVIDLGDYYRVPVDDRDLNYAIFLEEGDVRLNSMKEYNSNNTKMLNKAELKRLLNSSREIIDCQII